MFERDYSWDNLRAVLMLLGIPFHASLPYSYYSNSIVLSEPSLFAEIVGNALHAFRMGVFFVVAGYFAAHAIARKGSERWWALRWRNLLIPLLVAIVCFVPLQLYVKALDLGEGGAQTWVLFGDLIFTPQWQWSGHLWFLIVLLEFCLLTALLWSRAQPVLARVGATLKDLPPLLLVAFVIPLVLVPRLLIAWFGLHQAGVTAVLDVRRFSEYAPFFVLGLMLFTVPGMLDSFSRLRWQTVIGAVLACAMFILCDYVGQPLIALAAKAAAATLMSALLIGLARRYFSRTTLAVRWLVGAAFTIYLFHFPITAIVAYWLEPTDFSPELSMVVVMVAALSGSMLIHVVIERSAVLQLLFNGRPRSSARQLASA